mgnify:FL=1
MDKKIILNQLSDVAGVLESQDKILHANRVNFIMLKLADKDEDCPDATQDIKLNLNIWIH